MSGVSPHADDAVSRLRGVMQKYWGYDTFLPLQLEAMTCGFEDRDSVVVLPTGGGKSLCFQAPAICRDGLTLVVSPLISLMKDQVDALVQNGVPAACVNSTMSGSQKLDVAREIRSGRLKLLYIAPERLMQDRTLNFLRDDANLSMVAIDEAHCISSWGHDFRPEYRGLKIFKERFPGVGVHAYTATATEHVRRDIAEQLQLRDPEFLVGSFDRPNLVYSVRRINNRFGQICEIIDRHKDESGVVYCITKKEVDKTAAALAQLGYKAAPYHAGLSDYDRHRNQDDFINDKVNTIVATVAFGMGIDKSNVRYVVHAGMPKSLEHYQQESGRAGRDGLEAECRMLVAGNDFLIWQKMLDGGEAYEAGLQSLKAIEAYANGVTCRHRAIVAHFGQGLETDNCGACDVCLGELDLVDDPLIVGQKIVSCVARLQERFGVGYTGSVLAGSQEQRILDSGHDKLSTYGLLQEETLKTIRDWIEQLVGQGYLAKVGEYGTLSITDAGRQLLRGEQSPGLLRPAEKTSKPKECDAASWEGVDRGLFEALRALRKERAEEQSVPAYVVFSDATLRDMARRRPASTEAMRAVKGVGEKKLEDYGPAFIECIANYCSEQELATDVTPPPPTAAPPVDRGIKTSSIPAFEFFRQGMSVAEVAKAMSRAESTVGGYLGDYLRHDAVEDPSPWVDAATITRIEKAAAEVGYDRLRPIFEALGEEVSYNDIRIVLTCLQVRRDGERSS